MSGPSVLRIPGCSIRSGTAAFLATLLALAVSPLPAQQVELRLKYRAGDDYRHQNVETARSTTALGDVTQTITMVIRTTVLSAEPDGSATVRSTHESVQIVQESPMGRIEYDSRASTPFPTNPMFAAFGAFTALVGKSIEVTLGPDGKPIRTSGLEEIREEIVATASRNNPELAARLRESLQDASLEDLTGNMNVGGDQVFPSRPVAPGDEWTGDLSVGTDQTSMQVRHTYTLLEVGSEGGRQVARVGIKGTMSREVEATNPGAATMGKMGGEFLGELTFDVERGILLRSSQTQVVTVEFMGRTLRTNTSSTSELIP
jgi:hypothetical protein